MSSGRGTLLTDDGANIVFKTQGSGPTVLIFFNGWAGAMHHWKSQVDYFAAMFTCVMVDQRGHYESTSPSISRDTHTRERHAADIAAVATHLGVTKCFPVAHASGVPVALAFARDFPDLVDKLILVDAAINPPFPADQPPFKDIAGALMAPDGSGRSNMYGIYRGFFTPDDKIDQKYKTVVDQICKDTTTLEMSMLVEDLIGRWGPGTEIIAQGMTSPPPTLLVASDFIYSGALLKIPDEEYYAKHYKGTIQIERVSCNAHFVQVEKPDEVNKIIDKFIRS